MKKFLIPLLTAFSLAAPLSATTILVDFGSVATPGTTPAWNNFTGTADLSTIANLVDSTNSATGYALTLSGGSIVSLSNNTTSPITNTYSPFTPATVIQDSAFQAGDRVFTLSGLNDLVSYTLKFYSYVDRDTPRDTTFTITGYTPLSLHPSGSPAAFASGGEVGTIAAVTPTTGSIAITVHNVNANWILNGMEITYTVPEPSTTVLAALGLLPLLRRRRG